MRFRSRTIDLATAALIAAVLFAAVWYLPQGSKTQIAGPAFVVDGDSLEILGLPVRLAGIDAPEARQTCTLQGKAWECGRAATAALRQLIAGRPVSCQASGYDQYRRALARCMKGDTDINQWMVLEGWAVAFGSYQNAERQARAAGRGLWAASFERPGDWRKKHGL